MAEDAFIDRIIEGFDSMRHREHLELVARQFAEGEISFVVDRRGIRVVFEDDEGDVVDPSGLG